MKKLFWSAFAASLICLGAMAAEEVDLSRLEEELMPELAGPQGFTPQGMHQQESWNVKEKDVETDKEPLKGQHVSLIPWSTLNLEQWMDARTWIIERDLKDKNADWKLRLRDERQLELVGKVLSCRGKCPVYRGKNAAHVQHLSRILEGDEVRTEKDSVAWLFLMDGTLVRIGPESSVSLMEINISRNGFFYLVRLNHGHVFWHPPAGGEFPLEEAPETDAVSLPLPLKMANQEYFEREIYRQQTRQERLHEVIDLSDNAVKRQTKMLNELRAANRAKKSISARVMLVAPNATVISSRASFDFVYLMGGNSWFKKRTALDNEEFGLQLRGYSENTLVGITEQAWYEVAPAGREHKQLTEPSATLQVLELLTRRIKTFELARELWIRDFTLPILSTLDDPKKLAVEHGYALWTTNGPRYGFLVEYTRRIETTNIRSLENLLAKLAQSGHPVKLELSPIYYQDALNRYLLGLKSRYDNSKMQVREMNDLQYYVWTLSHGKR